MDINTQMKNNEKMRKKQKKQKNQKNEKIEILVIKKLTYTRIFIVLTLLMSIDMISSYIVTKHPLIYEYNNIGALAFSFGIPGLLLFYLSSICMICCTCIFTFIIEKTSFKLHAIHFRMKFFYLVLGMYTFVFLNNLKIIIRVFLIS